MKLKNVANVNTIIHGTILRETRGNPSRPADEPRAGSSRICECDRDSGDGTGGRERRVAVMNIKKFLASPSLLYLLRGYFQNAFS